MYIQSARIRSVSFSTFLKVIFYTYLNPQNGFFEKLKLRFGSGVQLHLNSEAAFTLLIKWFPGRVPGMFIALDERLEKRFRKIIERLGMKVLIYSGQKQLIEVCEATHVLAVIVPDSYDASHGRYKTRFEASKPFKIVYQNRRLPKSVDIRHDAYLWEPRSFPRSVSGAVLVLGADSLEETKQKLREALSKKPRLSASDFVTDLQRALRGYENRYRRLDRRPPKIMARLLYDIYK